MMLALLDYGMGNLKSVENAIKSVGAVVKITNNPEDIARAEGIIVPGVGAFSVGIIFLQQLNLVGSIEPVDRLYTPRSKIEVSMTFKAEYNAEGLISKK